MFWWRLIKAGGLPLPPRILQKLWTSEEVTEYLAFLAMEPLDDGWVQNALLMTKIDRFGGNKKTKIEDYVPSYKPPKKEQNVLAELAAAAKAQVKLSPNGNNRQS